MKRKWFYLALSLIASEVIGLSLGVGGWCASVHHTHTLGNVVAASAILAIAGAAFVWLTALLVLSVE